jgi:hypothetical protein
MNRKSLGAIGKTVVAKQEEYKAERPEIYTTVATAAINTYNKRQVVDATKIAKDAILVIEAESREEISHTECIALLKEFNKKIREL